MSGSTDISNINDSKIVVVSINFEINHKKKNPFFLLKNFFKEIAKIISKNTLIVIETTLPPGTCDQIIYPTLVDTFSKRGLAKNDILLSYLQVTYSTLLEMVNINHLFLNLLPHAQLEF